MADPWASPRSRRLSRLPIPITGFKKTRVISNFTASPLACSYDRMDLNGQEDHEESPAKYPRRGNNRTASGPGAHAVEPSHLPPRMLHESRRLSLIPNHESLLATPPQRRTSGRKSMAPNPYGIHIESCAGGGRRRSLSGDPNKLLVCVRKRPLSSKEATGSQDSIFCDPNENTVSINATRKRLDGLSKYEEEHMFRFDKVFDESADNHHVYDQVLSPLVKYASEGNNSTCFAYGQTGSGKTHTMFNEHFGLCYLAAHELFDLASKMQMEVYISFYEIYQGQLFDLLRQKRKIVACEKDGVISILGLEEELVGCVEDLVDSVKRGLLTRVTGSTGANSQSSRSHAVLQYSLRPCRKGDVYGRISFIDLAGSERGADRANVSKQTKLEGSEINKSLLALKECIRAMDLDSTRIPFRQSKLTMVLRDSFLGNSRTCMIATVSPASSNVEHSLNTLRYADRMKEAQGSGDGGEVVVTSANSRMSMWSSEIKENIAAPKLAPKSSIPESNRQSRPVSRQSTPEKSNGWSVEPVSGIGATRTRLRKHLDELAGMIKSCTSPDMLDLLEEEIIGLKNAFNTLG